MRTNLSAMFEQILLRGYFIERCLLFLESSLTDDISPTVSGETSSGNGSRRYRIT